MGRNEQHTERVRLASQARAAALTRLRAMHPDDYDELYREEAEKRGVKPQTRHNHPTEEKCTVGCPVVRRLLGT